MIKLMDLLLELSAGEQAKQQGLKSIGFGRYVYPKNPHTVVAKSEQGRLVPVGPHMKGPPTRPKLSSLERVPMAGTMDQLRGILTTQAEEGRLDTTKVISIWRNALRAVAAGHDKRDVILATLRDVSAELKLSAATSDTDRIQMGLKPSKYTNTPEPDLPSTMDLGLPRMKPRMARV